MEESKGKQTTRRELMRAVEKLVKKSVNTEDTLELRMHAMMLASLLKSVGMLDNLDRLAATLGYIIQTAVLTEHLRLCPDCSHSDPRQEEPDGADEPVQTIH